MLLILNESQDTVEKSGWTCRVGQGGTRQQ